MDLPTFLEANYITSFAAKAAWVLVYIVVYGLRPVLIRPKPIGEASFSSGRNSAPLYPCWGCLFNASALHVQ